MCQNRLFVVVAVTVDMLSFQRCVQLAFFILSFWRDVYMIGLGHYVTMEIHTGLFFVVVVVDILLFLR